MTEAVAVCRYCGRGIGDQFAGGPDDPAPGVCSNCISGRMAELMLAALRRNDEWPALKAWLRGEMIAFGTTPFWADRFVNADESAFVAALKRTHR